MIDRQILKHPALWLALVFIALGIVFIGLDVLDIAEDYRLNWPIASLNTVFISAVALVTLFFTARRYLKSGSPAMLALAGGVLAFGLAIVLYGWLVDTDLNTRITAYDFGALVAAAAYLLGAILTTAKPEISGKTGTKAIYLTLLGLAVLVVIGLVTWLAHRDIITFLGEETCTAIDSRDIFQGIAALGCLGACVIYLKQYHDTRSGSYLWYALGLLLFAAGVIFVARGPLESRIAWWGRATQYAAGCYFLAAAFKMRSLTGDSTVKEE